MFAEQMIILGNIFIVESSDAKIKKDIKQERKIKNSKIKSILLCPDCILNSPVDSEDPEGLD